VLVVVAVMKHVAGAGASLRIRVRLSFRIVAPPKLPPYYVFSGPMLSTTAACCPL